MIGEFERRAARPRGPSSGVAAEGMVPALKGWRL